MNQDENTLLLLLLSPLDKQGNRKQRCIRPAFNDMYSAIKNPQPFYEKEK